MKSKLLVVSAVAALIAGTTFASAQRTQGQGEGAMQGQAGVQGQTETSKPGSDGARRPAHAQPGKPNQAQSDKPANARAQAESPQGGRDAQSGQREQMRQGQREQGQRDQAPQQGQRQQTQQGQQQNQPAKQETQGQPQGASASVTLNTEQKTKIRQTILQSSSAPKVSRVDFDIRIGTPVPRTVKVVPVPPVLVEIHPQWRGYLYFVVGDQIVVVEPRTHEIVAVLEV